MLNLQTNPMLADAIPAMSQNDLQIHSTYDPSIFKVLKGNRNLNIPHIDRLVKSIQENGIIIQPIVVNENYEIIDGQHRLEAAKICKSIIYYIKVVGYDLKTAITLNINTSNWSTIDYVRSFCKRDYKDYIKLLELHEANKDFSIMICAELCHVKGLNHITLYKQPDRPNGDIIKRGLYLYDNNNDAEYIFEAMRKIKGVIEESQTTLFCRAIKKCLENKNFQLDQFVKKCLTHPTQYRKSNKLNIIIANIEHIYNFNVKNVKTRIYLSEK